MNTVDLIRIADKWLGEETGGNCSNLSRRQAVRAMVYFHQHLLKQCSVVRCKELLEQMFIDLQKLETEGDLHTIAKDRILKRKNALLLVTQMIDERPAL